MRRFLAFLGVLAVLGASQAMAFHEASSSGGCRWGNWVFIKGENYREFFSPFKGKGSRWFSDRHGHCYVQAVVPMASLEPVPSPGWFSVQGLGASPYRDGEGMSWGLWVLKDGRYLREFYPPVKVKGARLFYDPEGQGQCFVLPVVPNAELTPVKTPEWFSKDGAGTPPWRPEKDGQESSQE